MIRILIIVVVMISPVFLRAQNSIVQEGEFGIGLGAAHYFGDLNTRAKLNRLKPAASYFFAKTLEIMLRFVWQGHLLNSVIQIFTIHIMSLCIAATLALTQMFGS